ncbi:tRNA (adenine(37)-N6)-methyltransferase-like [Uloborus diversus]|uniref:tRNA (adenine(37)-N6)-methyltransferase-like n=1 Tax=Uloborus diversus TaxID=327109 RepID=UPI00240A9AFD|nr:tRNA (adenine(37)-N6)-methyltransferase-like [Uloborus diversus]
MAEVENLRSEIHLVRREFKNIRQELLKQKSNLKCEVGRIQSLLQEQVATKAQTSSEKNKYDNENERSYLMKPIGYISSCFRNKNGIPRQPLLSPTAKATLEINKTHFTNPEHSLIGLEKFSHIWLLFLFHKNGPEVSVKSKVHPPRLNGISTGVFSTRSPHRPCPIGLSLTKLDKINGNTLYLSGIDLLDGTPVLDIKPYIPHYDIPIPQQSADCCNEAKTEATCNDSHEEQVKADASDSNCATSLLKLPQIHLQVCFSERAINNLKLFHVNSHSHNKCPFCLQFLHSVKEAKQAITEVLQNDPRSVYRRQKCSDKLYYFELDVLHVTTWFDENIAEVLKIKPTHKSDESI